MKGQETQNQLKTSFANKGKKTALHIHLTKSTLFVSTRGSVVRLPLSNQNFMY